MSTLLLIGRLAARDVRRHAAQAILLVIAIAAASATLTMGLALSGVTSQSPYLATRAATNGPDVVAYLPSTSAAKPLLRAGGVAAHSGPYPLASGVISFDGRQADFYAQGRPAVSVASTPAAVDQPLVTSGSWVRPGGVVIERTFAAALGASVGDRVSLDGRSFTVTGIAVTAAEPAYPNMCYAATQATVGQDSFGDSSCAGSSNWLPREQALANTNQVGLLWATEADTIGLASKANPLSGYVLNLRLAHQAATSAFVFPLSQDPRLTGVTSWEGTQAVDELLIQDAGSVLHPGAMLLALLAIASVAVLVGRRLSEYARRVGLLKAVGATPSVVAAVFLAQNLVLALFAAGLGLVIGWLASPLLTNPGAALVGRAGAAPLATGTVEEVIGLAIVVALAATLVPAVRASRGSTVGALNDAARAPRRRSALIRISSRLPVPALFALRLIARRPRRALLTAANIAVTVTGLVAVLAFHAFADRKLSSAIAHTNSTLSDPVINRDEQMLTVITIVLVTLAVLNALFTTWAMVVDASRSSALLRALGARTGQLTAGLVTAQLLAALPGAIVGVPLGLALFNVTVAGATPPPASWLAAAVAAALAVIGALTIAPALIGTRQPVAQALASETA
jgi:hypothetical protein